ncbi:MAG: GAF domain-containing protein [Candidatus Brocadiaceae bacterium]|nr:GAF domain-containing protein [Candidatus Brocadiaceae bacterium]
MKWNTEKMVMDVGKQEDSGVTDPSIDNDLQMVHGTLTEFKLLTSFGKFPNSSKTEGKRTTGCKDVDTHRVRTPVETFELKKLYPLVNKLAVSGTGSQLGVIAFVDGSELYHMASMGFIGEQFNGKKNTGRGGIVERIVQHGKPIIVDDVENNIRFKNLKKEGFPARTLLSVPVMSRGRILGIICVGKKDLDICYTQNDLKFIETLAGHLSIAIENKGICDRTSNGNTLNQLTSHYYDSSNKYLPVLLRHIKTGAFSGCDLYLQTIVNKEIKYLLYCKGYKLFSDGRKESFVKKNINKIYVAKNGQSQYLRYLETNLEMILSDEMTSVHEKVRIVYDVALNMTSDVLKDYTTVVNLERAKEWMITTIHFLLHNEEASYLLLNMLTYKEDLFRHSANVAVLGILFGTYMNYSIKELVSLGTGLLFHDIGKTKIDPYLLEIETERMTREEKEQLRKHTDLGHIILSRNGDLFGDACLIAKQHHERYDGNGYPEGLKGQEIHYYSRIAGVLNEYEKQMSKNTIYNGNPAFKVLKQMIENREGCYDKNILKKFLEYLISCSKGDSAEDRFPLPCYTQ